MTDILIELDDRRRASLGRVGRHEKYLAHEEDDGTIILRPAVVMTETEAALLANPELVARIQHSLDHPETRVRRDRPKRKD